MIILQRHQEYKWKVYITDSFCIYVKEVPSAFHRKMQEIFFGFKWKKL